MKTSTHASLRLGGLDPPTQVYDGVPPSCWNTSTYRLRTLRLPPMPDLGRPGVGGGVTPMLCPRPCELSGAVTGGASPERCGSAGLVSSGARFERPRGAARGGDVKSTVDCARAGGGGPGVGAMPFARREAV
jgi:hypothetical protein